MAKKPAKDINFSVNSVAIEDDVNDITMNVTQETPEVTALGDTGPRRVVGNYDYNWSFSGAADFASGQSDATLFGLLGNSGVAVAFDPTGAEANTDDPNYDSTSSVLGSYSITGRVGDAVTFSAEIRGNSALARNTS